MSRILAICVLVAAAILVASASTLTTAKIASIGDGFATETADDDANSSLEWLKSLTAERLSSEAEAKKALEQKQLDLQNQKLSLIQADADVKARADQELHAAVDTFAEGTQKAIVAEQALQQKATVSAIASAKSLSAKINDAVAKQGELSRKSKLLQEDVRNLQADVSEAQKSFQSVNAKFLALKLQIREDGSNDTLKQQVDDAEAASEESRTNLEDSQSRLAQLKSSQQKIDAAFQTQVSNLIALKEAQSSMIQKISADAEKLNQQVASEHQVYSNIHESLLAVEQQLSSQSSSFQKQQAAQMAKMKVPLDAWNQAKVQNQQKIQNLKEQIVAAKAKLHLFNENVLRLENSVEQSEQEMKTERDSIAHFEHKVKLATAEADHILIESLESATSEADKESLRAKSNVEKQEMQTTVNLKQAAMEGEIAKCMQEVAQEKTEAKINRQGADEVKADIAHLKKQLADANKYKSVINKHISASKAAFEKAEAKFAQERSELSKKAFIDSAPRRLEDLKKEREVALEQIEAKETQKRLADVAKVFLQAKPAVQKEEQKAAKAEKAKAKTRNLNALQSVANKARKSRINILKTLLKTLRAEARRSNRLAVFKAKELLKARRESDKYESKSIEAAAVADALKAVAQTAIKAHAKAATEEKNAQIELARAAIDDKQQLTDLLEISQSKLEKAAIAKAKAVKAAFKADVQRKDAIERVEAAKSNVSKATEEYQSAKVAANKSFAVASSKASNKWNQRKLQIKRAVSAAKAAAEKLKDAQSAYKTARAVLRAARAQKKDAVEVESAQALARSLYKRRYRRQLVARSKAARAQYLKESSFTKFLERFAADVKRASQHASVRLQREESVFAVVRETEAKNMALARAAEHAVTVSLINMEKRTRDAEASSVSFNKQQADLKEKQARAQMALHKNVQLAYQAQQAAANQLAVDVKTKANALLQAHDALILAEKKLRVAEKAVESSKATKNKAIAKAAKCNKNAAVEKNEKQIVQCRYWISSVPRLTNRYDQALASLVATKRNLQLNKDAYTLARTSAFQAAGPNMPIKRIQLTVNLLKLREQLAVKVLQMKEENYTFIKDRLTKLLKERAFNAIGSAGYKQLSAQLPFIRRSEFKADLQRKGWTESRTAVRRLISLESKILGLLLSADNAANRVVKLLVNKYKAQISFRDAADEFASLSARHNACTAPVVKMVEEIDAMKSGEEKQSKSYELSKIIIQCKKIENAMDFAEQNKNRESGLLSTAKDAVKAATDVQLQAVEAVNTAINSAVDGAQANHKLKKSLLKKTQKSIRALKARLINPKRSRNRDEKRRGELARLRVAVKIQRRILHRALVELKHTRRIQREWAKDREVHESNLKLKVDELKAKAKVHVASRDVLAKTDAARKELARGSPASAAAANNALTQAQIALNVAKKAARKATADARKKIVQVILASVSIAKKLAIKAADKFQQQSKKVALKQQKAASAASKSGSFLEVKTVAAKASEFSKKAKAATLATKAAMNATGQYLSAQAKYVHAVKAVENASADARQAGIAAEEAKANDVLLEVKEDLKDAQQTLAKLNDRKAAADLKVTAATNALQSSQKAKSVLHDKIVSQAAIVGSSISSKQLLRNRISALKAEVAEADSASSSSQVGSVLAALDENVKAFKIERQDELRALRKFSEGADVDKREVKIEQARDEVKKQARLLRKVSEATARSSKSLTKTTAAIASNKQALKRALASIANAKIALSSSIVKLDSSLLDNVQLQAKKVKMLLFNQKKLVEQRKLSLAAANSASSSADGLLSSQQKAFAAANEKVNSARNQLKSLREKLLNSKSDSKRVAVLEKREKDVKREIKIAKLERHAVHRQVRKAQKQAVAAAKEQTSAQLSFKFEKKYLVLLQMTVRVANAKVTVFKNEVANKKVLESTDKSVAHVEQLAITNARVEDSKKLLRKAQDTLKSYIHTELERFVQDKLKYSRVLKQEYIKRNAELEASIRAMDSNSVEIAKYKAFSKTLNAAKQRTSIVSTSFNVFQRRVKALMAGASESTQRELDLKLQGEKDRSLLSKLIAAGKKEAKFLKSSIATQEKYLKKISLGVEKAKMALLQTEAANNLAKKNLEKALKALRSFQRKSKQQAGSSIKIIESWVASKSGRKSELKSLVNSSAAQVEQLKSKLVDTEDKLAKQVASLSEKANDNLKREIELLKQQIKIATNESNVAEAESMVAQYLFALGTDAINKLRLTNLKNQLALLNRRIVKKTNASTKAKVAVSNLKKEIAQQLTIVDNLNNQIKVGSASGLNVHAEAKRLAKAHARALNELKELENAAAEASAEADVQRQSALKSKSVSVYNVYRLLYSSSNSASYMKQWVQQVKRYIEQRQSSLF